MNEKKDSLQPDNVEHFQIEIDFHGLIDLLSNQLYKDKSAAIREILSNANDALRARIREGHDEAYSPSIRIWLDQSGRLAVRDNGIGMSETDLKQYLATIGASLAKERRKDHKTDNPFDDLIGRFGIGFLSSFIVADSIVVDTKKPGGVGLRWSSGGERGYTIGEQENLEDGTTVYLHLKPIVGKDWTADRLKRLVLENARNLFFPIYWGPAGEEKLNTLEAPWYGDKQLGDSDQEELRSFLAKYDERFTSALNAVEVLPIQTNDIRGVIYIPAFSAIEREKLGTIDLYCKRVFVAKDHSEIVPDEFPFIKGVLDCALFHLNAARDDVLRDDVYAYVTDFLGKRILDHLCQLAKTATPEGSAAGKPDRIRMRLQTLMDQYHMVVKRALGKKSARAFLFDDHYLLALQDFVPFQGSKYALTTLPQYLVRMKALGRENEILTLHPDEDLSAHRLISEHENLEFIVVRHAIEEDYLVRYAGVVGARCLSAADVFREHTKLPAIDGWEHIVRYYQDRLSHPEFTLTVSLSEFQPDNVPGRLLADKNSEGQQRLQDLIKELESGEVDKSDPLYLELARLRQKRPHFLYLNKRHPVLARLADLYRQGIDAEADLILHSMFHDMALSAGHPIHEGHIAEYQTKAYGKILEAVSGRQEVNMLKVELEKSRPLTPTNEVFFIRPLKEDPFDYLSDRFETVCKTKGLVFVDPKKLTLPGEITAEIIEYLQRSKIVIADVSENNPNVYYELGYVRAYLPKKLLLVANRSVLDSAKLPFDIQTLRVLGYGLQAQEFDRFISDFESVVSEMSSRVVSEMSSRKD